MSISTAQEKIQDIFSFITEAEKIQDIFSFITEAEIEWPLLLPAITGVLLITTILRTHSLGQKKQQGDNELEPHQQLNRFIWSVSKVCALMLGIALVGIPAMIKLSEHQEDVETQIQAFNGFSGIVLGLAIASAGAWVSIKLASLAIKIAENHFYSEESRKRYDDAIGVSRIIDGLDASISHLLISTYVFAYDLIKASPAPTSETRRKLNTQLKEISSQAKKYSALYQQALRNPTLLEALTSEYDFVNASSKDDLPLKERTSNWKFRHDDLETIEVFDAPCNHKQINKLRNHKQLSKLKINLSQEIIDHFFFVEESLKIICGEQSDSSHKKLGNSDALLDSLKDFAENVYRNSVSLCENLNIEMSQEDFDKLFHTFTSIIEKTKSAGDSDRLDPNRLSFYFLDYLFRNGHTMSGNGRAEHQVSKDKDISHNKVAPTREGSKKDATSYPPNTKFDAKYPKNPKEHLRNDCENLPPGKQPDQATFYKLYESDSETNQPIPVAIKNNKYNGPNTSIVEKVNISEEGPDENNTIPESDDDNTTSNNKVSISGVFFAAASYLIPRLPREIMQLEHYKYEGIDDFEAQKIRSCVIERIYAGSSGIHILKTGKSVGQHSERYDSQSMELRLYIYRSLSTPLNVGKQLIEPFKQKETSPPKLLADRITVDHFIAEINVRDAYLRAKE